VNHNNETAATNVAPSKAGDAFALLFKIGAAAFCMAVAILVTFALCAEFEVPMGKTVFLCVIAFIIVGNYVVDRMNGGKY
jgi:hypothetical protein